MMIEPRPLDQALFTNPFVDELPGEIAKDNRPRQVPGCCYSRVEPTPVHHPQLLAWSEDLAATLGLTLPEDGDPAVEILAGNRVTDSMKPFAARYGGHQFGNWAGQLGDGRAISLGQINATDGSLVEIQLKGAGLTPYSRRADGRAVLRSSLREFLCSEAMYHLDVPTTRALSLVGTGETVIRDMFYNGNPQAEPGAVVARVAPTFVRFGNFELMAVLGEHDNLRALADYVVRHHYPELDGPSRGDVYLNWFEEICRRTAVMIAHWMTVGFVHGVMNTDNMSILGVTIDYGPYGWLEPFEPGWTPNTTDFGQHRYAFGQQPRVAQWNLLQMARALSPLVPDVEALGRGLERYSTTLWETQRALWLKKLGLTERSTDEDQMLIEALLQHLAEHQLDMTLFFRTLSHQAPLLMAGTQAAESIFNALLDTTGYPATLQADRTAFRDWFSGYVQRLRQENAGAEAIRTAMLGINPKYVLRNYLAQNAIEKAEAGDFSLLHTLMTVLKTPFAEQPEHDALAAKRPDWAQFKPGCATLSCSS